MRQLTALSTMFGLLCWLAPSAATQAPAPLVIDLAAGQQDFRLTTITKRPAPIIQLTDHHQAVASGDLNGDGIGDIVVGAAAFIDVTPIAGEVFVVFGPMTQGGTTDLGNLTVAGARLTGADPGDMFGWSVAVADVNDDTQADLIVGALRGDGQGNARADAGDAYVFFGPIAAGSVISAAAADVTVHGVDAGDFLGFSLGAGDLSGDGVADLVLGARDADGFGNAFAATPLHRAGEVHALFGPLAPGTIDLAVTPSDVTVFGGAADYLLGQAITVGDVTGDDVGDLVMGAPRSNSQFGGVVRGQTHVLFGPLATGTVVDLRTGLADVSITGQSSTENMGAGVAVADVTGDGIGDLVTTASTAANRIPGAANFNVRTGAAYVFSGPLATGTHVLASAGSATVYIPDGPGDGMITSLAAGDLDGDGTADLVLGAKFAYGLPPSASPPAGEVYAVHGPFSAGMVIDLQTTSPAITVKGRTQGSRLGTTVAVGDVNDDGGGDLLVQASAINLTSIAHGEVYGVFGTAPVLSPATVTLAPADATTIVDAQHCVSATIHDARGRLVPDATVRFAVSGIVSASGVAVTGDDGQAAFCYTSPLPGADAVAAYADINADGVQDPDEPAGIATHTWALASSAPGCGFLVGAGIVAVDDGRAIFAVSVRKKSPVSAPHGTLVYLYGRGRLFHAMTIAQMIVDGDRVTLHGLGRDSGGALVPFRVDVSTARPESFAIRWPGHAAEGPVGAGGIALLPTRCSG